MSININLCKKCSEKYYSQAFSESSCIYCGDFISSSHMPPQKVCISCAIAYGVCRQCGEDLEITKQMNKYESKKYPIKVIIFAKTRVEVEKVFNILSKKYSENSMEFNSCNNGYWHIESDGFNNKDYVFELRIYNESQRTVRNDIILYYGDFTEKETWDMEMLNYRPINKTEGIFGSFKVLEKLL